MKKYFITGTDTDAGKTVISAILTEKLQADYWKPVQAGEPDNTDTDKVKALISNTKSVMHREAYRLQMPASPHIAAAREGIEISLSDLGLPQTDNHLIIEGAGGLMVPLNHKGELICDLIAKLDVACILVSRNYLGSINHTLLSIEVARQRGIKLAGIIFTGPPNLDTEKFILEYSGLILLGKIPWTDSLDKDFIKACTHKIQLP